MSARRERVAVVAFDACDPDVALALVRAGRMPNLGRVLARSARSPVRNPHGLFVGAVWPSFATANGPDRHGVHCWETIDLDTYERRTEPQQRGWGDTIWDLAGEAGRRVAVLDVPHTSSDREVNGVQVSEWGCHDRHFGLRSQPPSLADQVERTLGAHPILGEDTRAERAFAPDDYVLREGRLRAPDEEVALTQGLLSGIDAKVELSGDVLAQEAWDLFITVFGEGHAVGHQQWHLHDESHPRFDPAVQAAVGGDPLTQVYAELDTALGKLLVQLDDDTTLLVLLSHGMGPHHDGTHLLDQVLHRLDHVDRGGAAGSLPIALAKRAAGALPGDVRWRAASAASPLLRAAASRRSPEPCDEFIPAAERSRQRAYLSPNNFVVGGIRLNLVGREPQGCVQPYEVPALAERLRADLRDLVNVDTGGRVVLDVQPVTRWYPRGLVGTMPDLFVTWERTAPIETVWSPKVGLVHAPYTHWRTGDHRPDGLLLASGPGIGAGATAELRNVDLGPSILARLGVAADAYGDRDGDVVSWLAGR